MTATTVTLNGKPVAADIPARTHLGDFIREHAGLTGTHLGCEHGICGACTVEIDGEIARSCITFAAACNGASVRTIEGFDSDPLMVRLRKAFAEEHALQCGYCTPGMLIAARDLIRRRAAATESEIRIGMSGNLCRCTGYAGIVRAIARVVNEETAFASLADEDIAISHTLSLGPVGSHAAPAPKQREATAPEPRAQVAPLPRGAIVQASGGRDRIKAVTQAPREADGLTILEQSFLLPHPREVVWQRMRDLAFLVECLPGASLTNVSSNGSFEGTVRLSLGPISPSFKGRGLFTVSDADYTGQIEGGGSEERGSSNATGKMTFRLVTEGDTGTRVSTEIAYKLTGPLAQFARPALVTGILAEIGSAFATNLDRGLSGEEGGAAVQRKLSALLLLRALLEGWIRRIFKRS
jgi:aerobic carbon-monoxide dehydrogenase small subunit